MDIARPINASVLQIECPHCGLVEEDDYELLAGNVTVEVRCCGCNRTYTAAVMQCTKCDGESVFCWSQPPAGERFARLRCTICDHGYLDHETFSTSPAGTA